MLQVMVLPRLCEYQLELDAFKILVNKQSGGGGR